MLSQAVLDPGRRDRLRLAVVPELRDLRRQAGRDGRRTVPLRDHRYDLDALADAVAPRTKLVYVCHPNNPTGTMNTRAELDAFFERVPDDVLAVVDQAYFEYIDDPDYPDAVAEYFEGGRRVVVLRTFSKIYGLAGLRVGYAVGPRDVCAAMAKVRRPFDVTTTAQVAALASLDDAGEIARRRALNAAGPRASSRAILARARARARPPAPSATSSTSSSARTRPPLFERLLREGVIVRPLARLRRADGDPRLGRDARRARVPRRGARPHPAAELGVGRVERGDVLGDPLLELRVARRLSTPSAPRMASSAVGPRRAAAGRSRASVLLAAEREIEPSGV